MTYGFQPPQMAGSAAIPARSLLTQVLGISGLGFCITAFAAYVFQASPPGIGLIAMLVGLGFLIATRVFAQKNEHLALLLFYAFAFLEGIGIAPFVGQYVQTVGSSVVYEAAITTGLGMFALGAVVYATGLDLRRFQGYVSMALLALVVIGIASIFVRFLHPQLYAYLVLGIFTFYVLIDFARIRAGGGGANAVILSVSIYLDALNIFLALLQIFGGRRRD